MPPASPCCRQTPSPPVLDPGQAQPHITAGKVRNFGSITALLHLLQGMLPSFLCCWWHICHGTDLAALTVTQPELLSLLQKRTARYLGKTRLSCPVSFSPAHPSSRPQLSPCSQTCPHCSHHRRMLSRLRALKRELSLLQEAFAVHTAAVSSWSMTGKWGSCEPGHHSILLLLARSGLQDLCFSCNFLCNASESAAKSFSDSNNFSLQSSRVFPPAIPEKSRFRSAEILSNTS